MTILAGAFSLQSNTRLPRALCSALLANLSRDPSDPVAIFRDYRCLLAKVDIGAYEAPAFRRDPKGSVAMLAGEPLLRSGDGVSTGSRNRDLEILHQEWDRAAWSRLGASRGVFSGSHYAAAPGQLSLVTDKLGVRPLYYWVGPEYVVFASALRILEALPEVPKQMDLRGVTEIATLGYPLGDRTPYAGIRALQAAEVAQFTAEGLRRFRYWRWDAIPVSRLSEQELLQQAYARFAAAIANRLRGDTSTIAFLSGGLDSRCVVADLSQLGVETHTFSFVFTPGMQDPVFAAEFARRAGTVHHEVLADLASEAPIAFLMAQHWGEWRSRLSSPPRRPNLVWSGDGGSVGIGHVYMNPMIADHMRAKRFGAAATAFLEHQGIRLVRRLLQPSCAATVGKFPIEGIVTELQGIDCEESARRFHLFLMLNDQRRHLASHFEGIDRHRLELQLPFFDSDFLELFIGAPIDACLGHRLYVKWLSHFPDIVTAVPWQSYPGHVPCPIPIPKTLRYQWSRETWNRVARHRRERILRRAVGILRSDTFPSHVLSKERLRVAYWLTRSRVADYSYAIRFADTYCRYWGDR